ncbi:MAG: hypothetical protein MZV63_38560 [Marinilabiliales bacterium]|nr:hypothetical protein [Marinilabiliales bacterium]
MPSRPVTADQAPGAIGLSGLVEKEINLDLSFRLGDLCAIDGSGGGPGA